MSDPVDSPLTPAPRSRSGAFLFGSLLAHGVLTLALPHLGAASIDVDTPPSYVEFQVAVPEPPPEPPSAPVTAPAPPPEPAPKVVARPRPPPRPAPKPTPKPAPAVDTQPVVAEPVPAATGIPVAAPGPTSPQAPSPAPAAAPTSVAAPAPVAARGPDLRTLQRGYLMELTRTLRRLRHYPKRALQERLEGTVFLSIVIDASGRVKSVDVKRSSGHALLDRAALADVRASAHFGAPPAQLRWQDRAVTVPIAYIID